MRKIKRFPQAKFKVDVSLRNLLNSSVFYQITVEYHIKFNHCIVVGYFLTMQRCVALI